MNHSYKDFFKAAKQAKSQNHKKKSIVKNNMPLNKVKKSRQKKLFPPIIPSLVYIICFLLLGWGYLNIDEVLNFINKIEVTPMQSIVAAEKNAAKNTSDKESEKAINADQTKESNSEKLEKQNQFNSEDIRHFSKLNDRKKELDQREKELNELERELHEQRKVIEARIQKLEDIRKQIGQVLREKVEVDEERVKKLVEFYSNMKPQNAAKIVATLNEDLAVEILGRMKKEKCCRYLKFIIT